MHFTIYAGIVHLGPRPVKRPSALDSHFFQREFWLLCNQGGWKNMAPNKTTAVSAKKTVCHADMRLGKRLGSSPRSSSSALKEDFFWQSCEITSYILSILFHTRDIMWQWIGSQQRLLHFRLCLFPLFFRSGFRCQVWRFAPLLLQWPLGIERDKIQVTQREWDQFRTGAKGVDVVPVTVQRPHMLITHWSQPSHLSRYLFRKLQWFHVSIHDTQLYKLKPSLRIRYS